MTLQQLIERHEAHREAQAALTSLGIATVAARRFTRALAALDTEARTLLLEQTVRASWTQRTPARGEEQDR